MTSQPATVPASPELTPGANPGSGPGAGQDIGPFLAALLAAPALSDLAQRTLVRDAQDGDVAQALLDLGLVDPSHQGMARQRAARGAHARRTLLEACLGPVVLTTAQACGGALPGVAVEDGLARAAAAVSRYDPDVDKVSFLEWVKDRITRELADTTATEDNEGRHGRSGVVVAACARAALTGQPLETREVEILQLRFGDPHHRGLSLTETGEHLGISRYEVRATEARTIARLRRHPSTFGRR